MKNKQFIGKLAISLIEMSNPFMSMKESFEITQKKIFYVISNLKRKKNMTSFILNICKLNKKKMTRDLYEKKKTPYFIFLK